MSSPRTWDCVFPFATHLFNKKFPHPATRRRYQKLRLRSRVSSHVSLMKSPVRHGWGAHARSQARLQIPLPIFGLWRAKRIQYAFFTRRIKQFNTPKGAIACQFSRFPTTPFVVLHAQSLVCSVRARGCNLMSSPLTSMDNAICHIQCDLAYGDYKRWRGVAIPSRHTSGEQLSVQSEVWRYAQSPESILDDRMVDYDRVPR